MTNYIPLKHILRLIPKPLLLESNESDFLSWMLDGLRLLPTLAQTQTEIKVFELKDFKLELPETIKQINLVTYLASEPCEEDLDSITNCINNPEAETTDYSTENVCRYTINYKMFLDSPYYNNNYAPLKYAGHTNSIVCKDCPNRFANDCAYTFTIDDSKVLHTTLKDGFLCIDYETEICDENGDYATLDYQEIQEFLLKYALYKHWEERANFKEEGAMNMMKNYQQEAELAFKKAKGTILIKYADLHTIAKVVGNTYQKLIKIPEKYVYAR